MISTGDEIRAFLADCAGELAPFLPAEAAARAQRLHERVEAQIADAKARNAALSTPLQGDQS